MCAATSNLKNNHHRNIAQERIGNVMVLTAAAALVGDNNTTLQTAVRQSLASGCNHLVIDMCHVPFIDSEGLEMILAVVCEVECQGGDLFLAALNDTCHDILVATRLQGLLQSFANTELAVQRLAT